jgi:hypothetical protein
MGEINRRFNPEALERHCSCRICQDLRADRELREQAAAAIRESKRASKERARAQAA